MSISRHPEWLQLLQHDDIRKQISLGYQILPKLDVGDVSDVAMLFAESSDAHQKYVAAGLLLSLYRGDDPRFTDDERKRVEEAASDIITKEYPKTMLGGRSFYLLCSGDSARAEQVLLSAIDPVQLEGQDLRAYLVGLEYLRSPATIEKLGELEALGGEIGRLAYQSLGNIGKLSQSQLEALVNQFKSDSTAALLYKIFHVYLRFQIGKPLRFVRDLLGEPTRVGVNLEGNDCLFYQTDDPRAEVQIFFNKDGIITDTVADD
jgi:hypothetical protein